MEEKRIDAISKKVRQIKPEEIEVRASEVKDTRVVLVPYIDARIQMDMLDEAFGVDGWQDKYFLDGHNSLVCEISVWSDRLQQWVTRTDVGASKGTDEKIKDKSEYTDSFKRTAVKWGAGRELYSCVKMVVWKSMFKDYGIDVKEIDVGGGKTRFICWDDFDVTNCKIENGQIVGIEVCVNNRNKICFGDLAPKHGDSGSKAGLDRSGGVNPTGKGVELPKGVKPAPVKSDIPKGDTMGKPISSEDTVSEAEVPATDEVEVLDEKLRAALSEQVRMKGKVKSFFEWIESGSCSCIKWVAENGGDGTTKDAATFLWQLAIATNPDDPYGALKSLVVA